MATTLKEANFSGTGGSHFKIRLSYDLSQSINNNTSTIKYYLYVISMDGYSGSGATAKGYINNSQVGTFTSIGVNQTKQIGTKSVTVTHNNDGTKSVSYSASVDTTWSLGDASLSGTLTLPTIKRQATITSAPNFTDEQNPTITYSNPAGNSVSNLDVCIASTDGMTLYADYRAVSKTGSSYTFNLTETERYNLRYASRNSNTLSVKFFIRTIISGTTLRNSVQKTLTIVNANPTESSTFEETNQDVINLLGDDSADTIIQNVSDVKIVATATPQKESTIANVKIENNTRSTTIYAPPYQSWIVPTIDMFKVTTTDSRGNSTIHTYTKTMIEYTPVDITSFSFKRVNPTSSNLLLNAEIRYYQATFGNTANSPTIKWKKGTSGTPVTISSSDYTIDTTNNVITITNLLLSDIISYTDSETFYLYVEDLLSNDTENTLVTKGIPTFEAGEHDFQVNGDLYIAGQDRTNPVNVGETIKKHIISVGLTSNVSLTANGAKVATPNKILVQVGDTTKLHLGTNGVYIGENVNHVLVSAMIYVNIGTGTSNKVYNMYVYKNGAECLMSLNSGIGTNLNQTKTISPRLVNVSQGDYFQLGFYGRSGDTIAANDARTYITIEVVD